MTADVSIVCATGRVEPAFEWLADSLARQLGDGDDVEVVVVDRLHDRARGKRFRAAAAGRFKLVHVPPKPTPWQGPHRLTRADRFAASSARNSGLVHATAPYVAFVDDCAVVMPGWWDTVVRGARGGAVLAGAYQRRTAMVVRNGVLIDSQFETLGLDARWSRGNDSRPVAIGGGELYGSSFAAPRDLLLAVNGLDELCDGLGQEDVHLGLRLEAAGAKIAYARGMLTIESEELNHAGAALERHDRWLPAPRYIERLAEFGVHERHTDGPTDASHMMIDIVLGTGSWATHGNYYWLADLTPAHYAALVERFPTRHWFDGCPLRDL